MYSEYFTAVQLLIDASKSKAVWSEEIIIRVQKHVLAALQRSIEELYSATAQRHDCGDTDEFFACGTCQVSIFHDVSSLVLEMRGRRGDQASWQIFSAFG